MTPTLLIVLLGVVAEIAFGVILSSKTGFTVFHVLLLISLIYAFLATFNLFPSFNNAGKKTGKNKGTMEIVEQPTQPQRNVESEKQVVEEFSYERNFSFSEIKKSKIKFYKVSKNPNYVFADVGATCYLYKIEGENLVYVKSDKKGA